MDSTWLVALFGFAVGVFVGIIIYRSIGSSDAKASKLEQELADLQRKHADYKEGVTDHFNKTSVLIEDLTSNYVKVYKHLASGATQLADIQPAELLIDPPQENPLSSIANQTENAESDQDQDKAQFEPPKDYAPKEEGIDGTLSESFSTGSDQKQKPA